MPFDPELNLQKIADQVRVLETKAERQRKWADFARDLITQHSRTIAQLHLDKVALLEACEAWQAFASHVDACDDCSCDAYCSEGSALWNVANETGPAAIAKAKGAAS